MKLILIVAVIIAVSSFPGTTSTYAQKSASQNSPRRTLSLYLKALKSLDGDAMAVHWAEKLVTRYDDGSEEILDRDQSRKMRDFERERTQTTIYFVRNGKIYRFEDGGNQRHEHGDYATRYASFKAWLTKTAAAQDNRIMQGQSVVFDGESAKLLRPWLVRWNKECVLRPGPC